MFEANQSAANPATLDAAVKVKGSLEVMTNTDGWKIMEVFARDQIEVLLSQGDNVKTGEDALRILGQISGIRTMLRWPRIQAAALAQQINNQPAKKG